MNVKLKDGTIVEAEMTVLRKLENDARESKDGITLEICMKDRDITELSNIFTDDSIKEIICTTGQEDEKIYTQFDKVVGMSEIIDKDSIRTVVKIGINAEVI